MLSVISAARFMSRLNLRARLDQGIRKFHPLAHSPLTSFPARSSKLSIVFLESAVGVCTESPSADLSPEPHWTPETSTVCACFGQGGKSTRAAVAIAPRQRQAHPARYPIGSPHPGRVAAGRRSLALRTGCNWPANGSYAKTRIYNDLQNGRRPGTTTSTILPLKTPPKELFAFSKGGFLYPPLQSRASSKGIPPPLGHPFGASESSVVTSRGKNPSTACRRHAAEYTLSGRSCGLWPTTHPHVLPETRSPSSRRIRRTYALLNLGASRAA